MNNRTKVIAGGAIIAILLILVIYLNFFSGPSAPAVSPEVEKIIDAQIEHAKTNAPPEPDMSRVPEEVRKPGGKSTGR